MNGRQKQIYMNNETEKKALEACKQYGVSMSALICIALEDYMDRMKKEEISRGTTQNDVAKNN